MKFKIMKKLALILISVFMAGALTAQPSGGPERPGQEGPDFERLQILLDLSDEQVVQFKELHEKHQAERQARMDKMRQEREAQMQLMKEEREMAREAHHAELKQILSEEQFRKFEALMPAQDGMGRGMHGEGHFHGKHGAQGHPGNSKGERGKQFHKHNCYDIDRPQDPSEKDDQK